jgi:hypothetical protein
MRPVCTLVILVGAIAPLCAQATFYDNISPLVQTHCQQCHSPGQIAPMSLITYDDVANSSDDIARVLADQSMPPWKPVPGYGDFKHSYGLSDGDRQMFLSWIANGMTPGDPANAPPPLPASDGPWQLGTPDLVLQPSQYTPPPFASDTYRCFSLPTGLDSSTWVNAVQALPGSPREVHHVLVFLDQTGESAAMDGQDGQPGYNCFGGPGFTGANALQTAIGGLVGAWVPGAQISRLDPGIGILIPGQTRIVIQVHYHPSGRSSPDQTSIGFYFAPQNSVQHRLFTLPLVNTRFKIPANASGYQVTASFKVPFFLSGKAILVAPHMHLLGTRISVDMTDAQGTVTPMIRIDNWDFNWQGEYQYTQPLTIAANSTIKLTCVYDNSDQNPKNPNNPIIDVGWGEGTNDEMALAFVGVILDNEALAALFQ